MYAVMVGLLALVPSIVLASVEADEVGVASDRAVVEGGAMNAEICADGACGKKVLFKSKGRLQKEEVMKLADILFNEDKRNVAPPKIEALTTD